MEVDLDVGVGLFVAYRALESRVWAGMQAAGFRASLAQARLFARIPAGGMRLTDLATSSQVTKQTAGFLVDQLVTLGYVERVPDPTDLRARLVRATPYGVEAQQLASRLAREVESEWATHLGTDGLDQLRRLLGRLRLVTDPFFAAPPDATIP